ncbi:Microtubule-associated protein 1A [Geranomyces variabilis]|uniref:Microtubule-associated protein 1A n=1 Tax=Geranomyces variabilis TaxID=109894 RepID=A0AAD5XPM1_9FUNG|nr:Microtubule-associated protein 1A [Geranomyces variabilis]
MIVAKGGAHVGFSLQPEASETETIHQISQNLEICLVQRAAILVLGHTQDKNEQKLFLDDIGNFLEEMGVGDDAERQKIRQKITYDPASTTRHEELRLPCKGNVLAFGALTVLINPSCPEVETEIENLLSVPMTGDLYIAYAGHGDDDGDWVLRDDHFSLEDLANCMKAGNAKNPGSTKFTQSGVVDLNSCYGAKWASDSLEHHKDMYGQEGNNIFTRLRLQPMGNPKPIGLEGLWGRISADGSSGVRSGTGIVLSTPPSNECNISDFTEPHVLVFPANRGDCTLVSVGKFNLLIDGGLMGQLCCWSYIRRLKRPLTGIVVSHIDQDHITGALSLSKTYLEPPMTLTVECPPLYFNCPERIWETRHEAAEAPESRSAAEGMALARLYPIKPSQAMRGPELKPLLQLEADDNWEVTVHVVCPNHEDDILKELNRKWSEEPITAFGTYAKVKSSTGVFRESKEAKISNTNMASVCLLISIICKRTYKTIGHVTVQKGKVLKLLLPGDAPQNRILDGLKAMGELARPDLPYAYVHVPHHGSTKNCDGTFFQAVPAAVYNLTGNGKKYKHPEAIIVRELVEANGPASPKLLFSYSNARENAHAPSTENVFHIVEGLSGSDRYGRVNLLDKTITVHDIETDVIV